MGIYNDITYSLGTVFGFVELLNDNPPDDSIILKLLLVDTKHNPSNEKIKQAALNKVDGQSISDFFNSIINEDVRPLVAEYLLTNHSVPNEKELIRDHLPFLLENHMRYSSMQCFFERYWDDELAELFLTCFVRNNWLSANAQIFRRYADFFVTKFNQEQLQNFENKRETPIPHLVKREYKIWLELKTAKSDLLSE